MSAIAGICRRGGAASTRAEIAAMLDALDWWHADARGAWTGGSTALGHLLLRTTAASAHEVLPLEDDGAGLTITGHFRLDNRDDLASRLGIAAAGGTAACPDGRLALAAYREWGHACVHHLRGDFAFAVWDARAREMFCARDKFGVKPFYYSADDTTLAFASEIKGLVALPIIDRGVNERWIADYLHRLSVDRGATFYRAIRRLEPAHALTFGERGLRVTRYWQPDMHAELRLPREEDYLDLFREKLRLAVRRRLDTPATVGAELSGGLDSSVICAIAARELRGGGRELHTFSQVRGGCMDDRPGLAPDSRPAVELLLGHAGIAHANFFPGDGGVLEPLAWAFAHADEPVTAFPAFYSHSMYEAARAQGIGVMLSGFGGNNCVTDPAGARLRDLLRAFQWAELRRELACSDRPLRTLRHLLTSQFGSSYTDALLRKWHHWKAHPYRPTQPAFARRMGMWRRTLAHNQAGRPSGSLRARAIQALQGNLSTRIEGEALWSKGGRFEFRYPLLDEELVTTYLALPSRFKFWRGTGRYAMREASRGWIPESIRTSSGPRSAGHPGNLVRQQRDEAALKARVAALAADRGNPVWRYVDAAKLFEPPKIRGRVPRERHTEMLQVLMLERWLGWRGGSRDQLW